MKFKNHRYVWTKPFTTVSHEWSVTGSNAAISFHVSVDSGSMNAAGLEMHYFEPLDYMKDDAPSHLDCQFTGGRCWHVGTSLYATETLWPMVKPMLEAGEHERIFKLLERELEDHAREQPK